MGLKAGEMSPPTYLKLFLCLLCFTLASGMLSFVIWCIHFALFRSLFAMMSICIMLQLLQYHYLHFFAIIMHVCSTDPFILVTIT